MLKTMINLNKNRIEPLVKYTVDGREFNTHQDAEKYLREKEEEKSILEKNIELLDSLGQHQSYIPTWDEEEQKYDIFIKDKVENGGNWEVWQSLVDGREIRYYDTPLKIITPDEFMLKFTEHSTILVDNTDFNNFVRGVIQINERCENMLDWKVVIQLISNIQVTPVYIYE